jgi:DNA modification methylase
MPTLNWIGKEAVVKHHKDVPFRLLEPVADLSCGPADSGNLIVQGDNLHALKALLPRYAGKVKCIYIDPPYNTGSEEWIYNDNVNSPEIKAWLGQVVGKESEDLNRHDKWLCMMWPRLALLKQFLTDDGAIFISIDDTEIHNLRSIMDEIFGKSNFLSNIVWQSKDTPGNNSSGIAETHNHILIYKKSNQFIPNLLERNEQQLETYTNPDNDPRGDWLGSPLTRAEHRDRDYYPLKNNKNIDVWPPKGSSWRRPPKEMKRLQDENRIWWGKDGDATFPLEKKFLLEAKEGVVNQTWWPYKFAGSTRNASAELKNIFDKEKVFDTPKPTLLIRRILELATCPGDLILDSFAGSGTTAHAVLMKNVEDAGNRRFILVEMDSIIAKKVTSERVRRVACGYNNPKGDATPALGSGFRYCTLGEPLFDGDGQLSIELTFEALARHLYFTEFGEPLPSREPGQPLLGEGSFIGAFGDCALHLLFVPGQATLLDRAALKALPPFAGERVVFADGCSVPEAALAAAGVRFRQIPYDVRG